MDSGQEISFNIGKRIRKLREHLGYGRKNFAILIDVPMQTLIRVETKKGDFGTSIASKVCTLYPNFSVWIMTGEAIPENGQISPELETIQKDYKKQGGG
jgi:DNA-binding XRE family transcriptional regulator